MQNEHQPARMARLALTLVAAGLVANLAFNMVMARMGYEYPHDSFLFRPNDRWADFFKLAFAYPGAPIHAPVRDWAFQPLIDFLKKGADEFRGTSINPDHLPPLPTLLAVLVRRAFGLFDPMVVFIACAGAAVVAYGATLAEFAQRQEDRLRWMALGLLSYPFWFAADRGHFFSVICAITLIAAVRRMVTSRAIDWQSILLLAIACNFRPNVVIVPVVLVLGGQAGSFRDLVRLGLCGALVLTVSMLAAHWIYPHYQPASWMAGLQDYNNNYVKVPLTLGFVTSLPSLLNLTFGFSQIWSLVGLALAAVMGVATLLAARSGLLSIGQILFLALGLMVIAIPGFADYHLIPFLLPVILIASQFGAVTRGDWIAFLASVALLVPKNYVWGDDDFWHAWSYQIVLNPLIVVAAMVAVLALAFRSPRPAAAA